MKKWYHSRVLYSNIIAVVVILLVNFGYGNISADVAAAEVSILGVINLVLRLLTNQGLSK